MATDKVTRDRRRGGASHQADDHGRLSESERQRMLQDFDTLLPLVPPRPQKEVNDELKEIRRARRSGGRRTKLVKSH
jgi:hypothetical protein